MTTTRDVTREISIAAPVDAVWKALTDAEELVRWFPPVATVQPGPGGRLRREWQTGEAIEERIGRGREAHERSPWPASGDSAGRVAGLLCK